MKSFKERKDLVNKTITFIDPFSNETRLAKPFAVFEGIFTNPNVPELHGKNVYRMRYPVGGADIPVENIILIENG